jgi:hypothetical protein
MKCIPRSARQLASVATFALATSFASAACVKPMNVSIDEMFHEIKYDEVGALNKYHGQLVRVTGRVSNKGLKTRSEVVGEVEGGGWHRTVTVTTKSSQIPFVVLSADSEAQGEVICYFDTPSDVAGVTEGEWAVLEGTVSRVKSRGELSLVHMVECESAESTGSEKGNGWSLD